jgi:hypothetical protein
VKDTHIPGRVNPTIFEISQAIHLFARTPDCRIDLSVGKEIRNGELLMFCLINICFECKTGVRKYEELYD